MPTLKITDDLGRTLVFGKTPARVVSLVPSDTYSMIALGARDRLVGVTTYCDAPGVATVGGTKNASVENILELQPDLVIANQEENTRPVLEALANQRITVLVSLPRRVAEGVAHLARLARVLGVDGKPEVRDLLRRGMAIGEPAAATRRGFVPIWMDPVMTINADTFGSDVLAHAGVANTFSDRLRLYPLAADLGKGEAIEATGRDVRYPRVTLDEVAKRGAELIVLTDEPYEFGAADEATLQAALPGARVVRVSGKDLFWYGAWTIDALPKLTAQLADG